MQLSEEMPDRPLWIYSVNRINELINNTSAE